MNNAKYTQLYRYAQMALSLAVELIHTQQKLSIEAKRSYLIAYLLSSWSEATTIVRSGCLTDICTAFLSPWVSPLA
jgi:hypothetical protein